MHWRMGLVVQQDNLPCHKNQEFKTVRVGTPIWFPYPGQVFMPDKKPTQILFPFTLNFALKFQSIRTHTERHTCTWQNLGDHGRNRDTLLGSLCMWAWDWLCQVAVASISFTGNQTPNSWYCTIVATSVIKGEVLRWLKWLLSVSN